MALLLATLTLTACRGPIANQPSASHAPPPNQGLPPQTLPPEAWSGPVAPGVASAAALAPWRPPGIRGPWPREEYLRDGGDHGLPAQVSSESTIEGIDQEDTVAYYQTLDGRHVIEPSNRVHIYAPRFGSVRHVEQLNENEVGHRAAGVDQRQQTVRQDEVQIATTAMQPRQPVDQLGLQPASIYRGRQQGIAVEARERLAAFQDRLKAYENFTIIRLGRYGQQEQAALARSAQAAIAWSADQTVQVVLEGHAASEVTSDRHVGSVHRLLDKKRPALRIVKIASRSTARPGETVDFTLRFDNIGSEVIGNVSILDNLATRLEYVPESGQSSLPAKLITDPNRGGSLGLTWEIENPLKPGDGGIIRFRCKVR